MACSFGAVAERFTMDHGFHDAGTRTKVLVMVSRFGHYLNDILFRRRIGALPVDIVGVVSNHRDYAVLAASHAIPVHHVPVTKENKAEVEARILNVVEGTGTELIVLGRHMQVLSDPMCRRMSERIITFTIPSCRASKAPIPTGRRTSGAWVFPASPDEHASERMG